MRDEQDEDGEHSAIDKLIKLIDQGKLSDFDEREVSTIRRMIRTYEGFESFGRAAEVARGVVIWLGVMLGAYFAVTGWFGKIVRSLAQGG